MSPPTTGDPRVELAAWLELARQTVASEDVDRFLRTLLADLPVRPYAPWRAGGGARAEVAPTAAGNVVVVVPGRCPPLRPLVLVARTDLLDPSGLAGLAAALAVPAMLVEADLERDVILVLGDEAAAAARSGHGADAGPRHRAGAHAWFDHERRHDIKAVVVMERLGRGRGAPSDLDLLQVAGVETDARMPTVLHDAAPAGCGLVLTRHGADGLPFARHGVPYLRIGLLGGREQGGAAEGGADHGGADPGLADLERLARHAAELATTLLVRLDGARLPGPFNGYDSTDVEIAALAKALGRRLDDYGGPPLERGDLDRVVSALA